MADAGGKGHDWSYLDDVVSAVVLLSVALTVPIGAAVGAYLVVSGSITLTGSVDIGAIVSTYLAPLFVILFLLAILDVYGKRRVRGATKLLADLFNPERNPGREARDDE